MERVQTLYNSSTNPKAKQKMNMIVYNQEMSYEDSVLFDQFIKKVCIKNRISEKSLMGRVRDGRHSYIRHSIAYLLYVRMGMKKISIARILNKHHANITYSIQKFENDLISKKCLSFYDRVEQDWNKVFKGTGYEINESERHLYRPSVEIKINHRVLNTHSLLLTLDDKKKEEELRFYWVDRISKQLRRNFSWEVINIMTGRTRQSWNNGIKRRKKIVSQFINTVATYMKKNGFTIPTDQIIEDFENGVPKDAVVNFERIEMSLNEVAPVKNKRIQTKDLHKSITLEGITNMFINNELQANEFQAALEVFKMIKEKV